MPHSVPSWNSLEDGATRVAEVLRPGEWQGDGHHQRKGPQPHGNENLQAHLVHRAYRPRDRNLPQSTFASRIFK